jgi:hypothetical protein
LTLLRGRITRCDRYLESDGESHACSGEEGEEEAADELITPRMLPDVVVVFRNSW